MINYNEDKITALEAKEKAQWITFAPIVFQAARALRNMGILAAIEKHTGEGIELCDIEKECNLSHYGARVLCEAGLAIDLLFLKNNKYCLTKTACFFISDKLTEANCDFVNDVCYEGLFRLEDSINSGKPEGLKVFGNWPTLYEALVHMPTKAKESWFKFDHYYSDQAFGNILPIVFQNNPLQILDIGGNTGKFAFQCIEYSTEAHVTIIDLSSQLNNAREFIIKHEFEKRISLIPVDLLNEKQKIPEGFDIIWMSQFLDCFSDEQIISILKRCSNSMSSNARVFILEPFWDRQRFKASAFSLQMTSLYFTAIANGNSQMYHFEVFKGILVKI